MSASAGAGCWPFSTSAAGMLTAGSNDRRLFAAYPTTAQAQDNKYHRHCAFEKFGQQYMNVFRQVQISRFEKGI
jgi:hypothetical protein